MGTKVNLIVELIATLNALPAESTLHLIIYMLPLEVSRLFSGAQGAE